MKKQIVVATVALALAAPVVIHAEATVYGRVVAGAVYIDTDEKDVDGSWDLGATGEDGGGEIGSRFGVTGSTDLGNGMEAGFQLERNFGSGVGQRYNNVYLSGGWGKVTLGQQDNSYNSARNWDQTYYTGGAHGIIGSRTEGIQYSMSTGGFSFDIMAMANDADQDDTIGGVAAACTGDCGSGMIAQAGGDNSVGGDGVDGWIIRAGYDFGVVNLNVAHSTGDHDLKITEASGSTPPTDATQLGVYQTELESAHALGRLAADEADRSGTAIGINGAAGPVDWYLAYQASELNASGYENDVDSIGGFLGFRMSERDTLYAYYVSHSADRASDVGTDDELGEDYSETVIGYARTIGPGVNFVAEYNSLDNDLPSGTDSDSPSKLVLAVRYSF